MTTTARTYRLLPTGTRALGSEKSVPPWYRAILGLLHGEMTSSEIVDAMSGRSKKEVLKWIDELETLGFVELVVPAVSKASAEVAVDLGVDMLLARLRAA
jgi:hypothetical protein